MTSPSLSWEEVCRRRLAAQHLRAPLPATSFHRMVSDICGLHAQVMSAAELAAAVRVEGLGRDVVPTALWADRALVKMWAMRGTLHLLLAQEVPIYVAALSDRRFDLDAPWLKYHGLAATEVPALIDAVASALDGRQLTREELGREVVRLLGDRKFEAMLASGWAAVLKPAAFQGLLCFGPSDGNRVTFVRPDQWIGDFDRPDPVESLREMARRFLAAYGPARLEDFARWWGVAPKAVRSVFRAGDGFSEVGGAEGVDSDRRNRSGQRSGRARPGRAPPAPFSIPTRSLSAGAVTDRWPDRPRTSSTARRGGSHRCCSSTGSWPSSGSTPRAGAGFVSTSTRSAPSTRSSPSGQPRRPCGWPPTSVHRSAWRSRRRQRVRGRGGGGRTLPERAVYAKDRPHGTCRPPAPPASWTAVGGARRHRRSLRHPRMTGAAVSFEPRWAGS